MEALATVAGQDFSRIPLVMAGRPTTTGFYARGSQNGLVLVTPSGVFESATGAHYAIESASQWVPYVKRLGVGVDYANIGGHELEQPVAEDASTVLAYVTKVFPISQVQLADFFGVSRQTVNHWFRSTRNMSQDKYDRLLNLRDVARLFEGKPIRNLSFLLNAKIIDGRSILEALKVGPLDTPLVTRIVDSAVRSSARLDSLKFNRFGQRGGPSLMALAGANEIQPEDMPVLRD